MRRDWPAVAVPYVENAVVAVAPESQVDRRRRRGRSRSVSPDAVERYGGADGDELVHEYLGLVSRARLRLASLRRTAVGAGKLAVMAAF